MKLLRSSEVAFSPGRVVFRQSRLAGTIGLGLLGTIFLGAGPLWWFLGAPWVVWGLCGLVALLVVPACAGSLLALYRQSNWLVAIEPEVVWVNLRSHLNDHLPEGQTVVRLELAEIASASLYSETFSTPDSEGGSRSQAMNCIALKLRDVDTQRLAQALDVERNQKPIPRKFLGVSTSSVARHYPVSIPEPGTMRIAWRSTTASDQVTPSARHALRLLQTAGVPSRAPVRRQRADWSKLEGAELESLVRTLALSGNSLEATELLREKRRLEWTEARRQVEELARRG